MTSITLNKVPFTLLEAIGSLSPLVVAFITSLSDTRTAAEQLNQMEKFGDETVTKKSELFLDNPCKADNPFKAPKETGHETAEDGIAGVKAAALNHSTLDIMTLVPSYLALGARVPRSSSGAGGNGRGAKNAAPELVRAGGASLCHPSPRGVVKAIPSIQAVRWFPVASYSDADRGTVSLRADLSWWKSTC